MSTSISTKTKAERELEKIEQEINTESFEAFFHIGQKLLDIRKNRRYEAAGFKTWGAYCASGRIEYGTRQADRYIRAAELRPKIESSMTHHDWTVAEMLELCKCETDIDAKRVAEKSIAAAKKRGEQVTARLIAEIRDSKTETGADDKRHKDKLQQASLDVQLSKLSDILVNWRVSLEALDSLHWDSVSPVVLTRVRTEANALAKLLRS